MSRIQPGTICKIVNASRYVGRMVVALERAPTGDYTLPDGYPAVPGRPGVWVIESLDGLFEAPIYTFGRKTGSRMTRFAAVDEKYLKPYDPGAEPDEILRKVGKPKTNVMAPRRQVEFSR
jgi:hypothetical protein